MSDEKIYMRIRAEGCSRSSLVVTIEEAIEELKNIHESGDDSGFVFEPVLMTVDEFESMPDFDGF